MSKDDPAPAPEEGIPLRELERRHRGQAKRAHRPPGPERSYPLMRAMLEHPDQVPYGLDPNPAPEVPGTFIPNRRAKPRSDSIERADQLLQEMASGLLVGGDERGSREVRITLSDEFFQGTELWLSIAGGQVSAVLHPPDLAIHALLEREMDRLREHLESCGLVVSRVEVMRP